MLSMQIEFEDPLERRRARRMAQNRLHSVRLALCGLWVGDGVAAHTHIYQRIKSTNGRHVRN